LSTSRELNRKDEIKSSIQRQYLRAAEKGEISFVKAWRVMRGMDQAAFAAKAKMTEPEVARAEAPGHARRMNAESLLRIAQALMVPPGKLLH
jgi:transcriptional regulator with XRE-family HTH domain